MSPVRKKVVDTSWRLRGVGGAERMRIVDTAHVRVVDTVQNTVWSRIVDPSYSMALVPGIVGVTIGRRLLVTIPG